MTFAAMEEWEDMNSIARGANKPFKLYRAIELMLSTIFYILELRIRIDKHSTFGRTFLIEDFETLLGILNDTQHEKHHQLSIFVPGSFKKKKQDSIHVVRKIFRKQNENTIDLYVYECIDGKTIMNMEIDKKHLSKKELTCIYDVNSKHF